MRSKLFRGDRQRRLRAAEAGEEFRLVLLRHREVARLDVAEAADLLGDRRKADRSGVVLRRQVGDDLPSSAS